MTIKLRALVKHPSRLLGDAGIHVDKANGVVTVGLDLAAFDTTPSIADQQATTILLITPGVADGEPASMARMSVDDLFALALNFDAELAAIAGLASAADRLPYFTGSGSAALAEFTPFARSLVDDASAGAALTTLGVSAFAQSVLDDTTAAAALATLGISAFAQTLLDDTGAGAARATLGLAIGIDVQAFDAELAALAGLASAADKLPYFTGSGTAALADFTSFGRSLVDDSSAPAARGTLGLVIGADVQAQDAELSAIAALASAADKLPFFTGSGTASLADFTAFGRDLVDDANAAAARTTLGLTIGADVQPFHARLTDVAAAAYAQGAVLYHNGSNLTVLPPGASGQFLKTLGASADPIWDSVPGGGDMLAANNLSDVADANAALANLNAWSTGDVKLTIKSVADATWVMMNDGTIGSASSPATTRAHADTEALFTLLWNNVSDSYAPVSGGRGASASADWSANKTIRLLTVLGRSLAVAGAGTGLTARALGANAGAETEAPTLAKTAAHAHTVDTSHLAAALPGAIAGQPPWGRNGSYSSASAHSTSNAGSGVPLNILDPSVYFNVMIKL